MAKYGQAVDRQSAYEMLTARVAPRARRGRRRCQHPRPVADRAAGRRPPTLGADGWPTLTPEPYNPYLDDTPAPPAPQPAPRGRSRGSARSPAASARC